MDRRHAIIAARKGQEAGFRWLFEADQGVLRRFVFSVAQLDGDAIADVVQNSFVRAFGNLNTLRDDAAYPGWLLTIARRETLRHVQRRRLQAEPLEDALTKVCERDERLEAAREKERILAQIRALTETIEPHAIRDTAIRYYLGEKCTTEALAAELGVPHGTVRKRLFSFRQKLRKRLLLELG